MAVAPGVFIFPQNAYTTTLNTLANIWAPSAPSTGCGSDLPENLTPGGNSVNLTIQSPLSSPNTTLQQREYLIHIPESYPTSNDDPRPLILTFHGQYQWTESIERYSGFSTSAFNPHSIAVYPAGVGNQWLGDVLAPNSSEINDVQFVSDVLDDLESKLCIDKNRIYAAGLSNGGGMTGLLACNGTVGGRFAALAGVAAAYYPDESLPEHLFGEQCGLNRDEGVQIPYLEIHGEKDQVVRYNGSNSPDPDTYNVPAFLSKLAKLNRCAADAEGNSGLFGVETNSTQTLNGGNVIRYSWTCAGAEDVLVHYNVKDLGHGWPSTIAVGGILDEFRLGPTNWNASEVIGEWFGKWALRCAKADVSAILTSLTAASRSTG